MFIKLLFVNLLTFVRVIGTIALIPIYNNFGGFYVAILTLLCYLTDLVDGFLARRWKVSTFFGALFDSSADKLLSIVNFIVLYIITPYAIIPIICELLIVIVHLIKFNKNYNIKTNFFGKIKVWVLATSIILTFLVSDYSNIPFISLNIKLFLKSLSVNNYIYLLLPAIIVDTLALYSYIFEFSEKDKIKKKEDVIVNKKSKNTKEHIKDIWLNPEFYNNHKDDTNLKDLRKVSKE